MRIFIELTGPRASGKTHMADLIAELIQREGFGAEYKIVSRLPGGRVKEEREGRSNIFPPCFEEEK